MTVFDYDTCTYGCQMLQGYQRDSMCMTLIQCDMSGINIQCVVVHFMRCVTVSPGPWHITT